ncbi:hypothetical protein L5515_017331 [Caenorhabditis briggsae]|uniref:Uncharacterized protein n=1 Tax=Caenorhabditis briggsae TaxID=6238 RepID=A0AAE9FCX4_CAEBR|nr:hypothetical protein L5515_017331 [Caenorhabditis briggsae]
MKLNQCCQLDFTIVFEKFDNSKCGKALRRNGNKAPSPFSTWVLLLQSKCTQEYPKWNELKSTEDEEWTKMWQILRKEQERQWKAGLMKFEKVMLFI